jgi:8-oxo-dGTP pyrophosphatase MutT (NUDIX family)
MFSIAELAELVRGTDPGPDARFRKSRDLTLALLAQGHRVLSRSHYQPGHITGSAIVLSPRRTEVLLVHHRRLQRWLQPGGHVEPEDRTPMATAVREVAEETGIDVSRSPGPVIVGIDVHQIPGSSDEPPHLHHDVVWRFIASGDLAGSEQAAWCPVGDLDACDPDAALRSSLQRALQLP